ncbi:MAG: 50S ribosomal protein L22 [Dehalococcoidia bacterium]|nr:50S ribosomal protein L22 [Dehalococcoidia bacterium]
MQVKASVKNVGVPSKKLRLIADTVRGKHVGDAVNILTFLASPSARHVLKVVKSAAANAEKNHQLLATDLKVLRIMVDEGPTTKRIRARAKGRASRILKRSSHITVIVEDSAVGT